MTSSADHISGLTGASPAVTISKNGAAPVTPSGAVAEIANGWYKLTPSGADATTNGMLILHASAAGGDPADVTAQVVAFSPYDSTRLGLSALPDAASGASGGLPLGDGSGDVTLTTTSSTALVTALAASILTNPSHLLATDASGRVTVGTNSDKTGYSLTQSFPANFGSLAVSSGGNVTVGGYATGEDPASLTWNALTASFTTAGSFGDGLGSGGGGDGPTLTEIVDGILDAALSAHTGAGTPGAALGALVGALTESYAANGQPATMAQLLYGIMALLGNVAQSGTTITASRLDGTTPAMTFTLDSATAPASRRRAS
jgi:hypothetical protein